MGWDPEDQLKDHIKPVRLAKVVVIQHGYPELHRLLQHRPERLAELERFLRMEQTNMSQEVPVPGTPPAESPAEPASGPAPLPGPQPVDPRSQWPPEMGPVVHIEPLRRMLLLHPLPDDSQAPEEDDCNFGHLDRSQLAI